MRLLAAATDAALDPRNLSWLSPLLLAADALLCGLIVHRVPYTEIDWKAYMEQVQQYISGERNYTKIRGGTGALVYPAAHVYIYRGLHFLTDRGHDILTAQVVFAALYLCTLALVMACYRRAQAPPYIFPLLVLSKRLHSIYLLRLFNDCFAVAALFLAIYAYQRRMWTVGSLVYSFAIAIKMSVLLALPGLALMLYQGALIGRSFGWTLAHAVLIIGTQILLAVPFLKSNAVGYFSRAFEFGRKFLFKWTVNWRFVGEEVFDSKTFSIALLAAQLLLLVLFATSRWIRPSRTGLWELTRTAFKPLPIHTQRAISARVNPKFVLTTVITSNAIGMLCARSLHYQFYAWLAWGSPFLLWRTGFHPVIQYVLWVAQEWAWNVYPSTDTSSKVVVGVLAVMVAGVWTNTRNEQYGPDMKDTRREALKASGS